MTGFVVQGHIPTYIYIDILKNISNQTVAGSHWLPQYGEKYNEGNGYQQLFG